jgi:hypothetical protein
LLRPSLNQILFVLKIIFAKIIGFLYFISSYAAKQSVGHHAVSCSHQADSSKKPPDSPSSFFRQQAFRVPSGYPFFCRSPQ